MIIALSVVSERFHRKIILKFGNIIRVSSHHLARDRLNVVWRELKLLQFSVTERSEISLDSIGK